MQPGSTPRRPARASGSDWSWRCSSTGLAAGSRPPAEAAGQPARQGDQPVPAAARPQPGRLVPLGARGVRQGEGREEADLPVGRLLGRATGATSWSASASMDPEIAKLLNEKFVCIKVDREERPDVDQVYMAALQAFGNGGWPMSMFLTPDGRPFFGGTYFPPDGPRRDARASRRVLDRRRRGLARPAGRGREGRRPAPDARPPDARRRRRRPPRPALARRWPPRAAAQLAEQFDPEYGGFGFNPENARRPKFPEPVNLVFLLDQHRRDRRGRRREAERGEPPGPLGDGRRRRSTTWPAAASATSSPAAITATPRAGTGSSPTSRRCSTTTPSSPRPTCSPSRPPATRAGGTRPRPPSRSSPGP